MKKLLSIILGIIGILFAITAYSGVAFATIGAGWNATSTNVGSIQPTSINGNVPFLNVPGIISTASSTFTSSVRLPSLSTGCLQVSSGLINSTGSSCAGAGTNFFTSSTSAAYTYLNTGTILQSPAIFATSTTATSTIADLNGKYYVPWDFATNGCANDPTKTDFGSCVNALYAKGVAQGLTQVAIGIPAMKIPAANWTTPINFGTNGTEGALQCERGAVLIYGGTATSTLWNGGNPTGHTISDNYGCVMQGQASRVAAGNTNSNTTVGIGLGGANGAVGVHFHDWDLNGFGQNIHISNNAYDLSFTSVNSTGGNGGVKGDLLYIDVASNSGERNVFDNMFFSDPGNSIEDNAIYISRAATASNFFSNLSLDDAQVFTGSSNGINSWDKIHIENAAFGTYGQYIPFIGESSDTSTLLSFTNIVIANDTSGANSFDTIFKVGGPVNVTGVLVANYGGGTITNLVDHSLDNGVSHDHVCQVQVISGSLTNIIAGSGGVAYSRATGGSCVDNTDNSYTIGLRANGSNTNEFFSGSVTTGTFDHNGNWTLGVSAVPSIITINNKLAVTTSESIASSTPFGKLSINPVAGDSVALAVGSSTANLFQVNTNGQVALGNALFGGAPVIAGLGTSVSKLVVSENINNLARGLDIANINMGANAETGITFENGNSTNAGAASAYIAGVVYGGPNFATAGFGGLAPNGLAIFNTDGRVDIGATSANAASSTVNFYAGNNGSFAGGVPDMTLTGGTANLGLGTTSPGARLGIQGMAGGSIPLLLVSSSTSGAATSTVLMLDKNGVLTLSSFGTTTANNGMNITSGCYAFAGTCIAGGGGGGSGTVSSGLAGQLGFYNSSGTTIQGTSTAPLYVGSIIATSSSLVSQFAGGFLSTASSTINGNATTTGTLFAGNNVYLGTPKSNGSVFWNKATNFLGIYDAVNNNIYYGLSPTLPGPAGTVALGGFYSGMAIQGSTANTGVPIFGILSSTDNGNSNAGIGHNAFTIQDGHQVYTFNNTLDNGLGNLGVGTSSPYASTSIQSGTSIGDAFVVATSSTKTIFGIDNDGHTFTSGPLPTITGGATNGTVVGDDEGGTITTGTAISSVILNFSKAYRNTPYCNVSDDSTASVADVSSISTSAVTFGLSVGLSGGHLYYSCAYHK